MNERTRTGFRTLSQHLRRAAPLLLLTTLAVVLTGCSGGNLFELMSSSYWFSCCGLIHIILAVLAIIEIMKSPRETLSKALWIALIVFFPVGGLIVYYFFGK
jgi:hypothetical protein